MCYSEPPANCWDFPGTSGTAASDGVGAVGTAASAEGGVACLYI